MPKIEPIGRVKGLDLEPLTIPIIGYDKDNKEVITDIQFWGEAPAGSHFDMLSSIRGDGMIGDQDAMEYVKQCVLPEDREKWNDLIHGQDVFVRKATVIEAYTALITFYTDRPTKQRPASRGGRPSTGPTSPAASSAKGSHKRTSK